MDSTHSLELGRRRFDDRIWDEAYESLRAAAEEAALEAEDCERLATAAYLSGHDDESAAAWTSAHREWLQRSEFGSAIRCAFWLAFSLLQRGDGAQGGGWLARAGQLLEEHRLDTVEQGYLAIPPGMVALHSGELSDARTQFERVRDVARRFADADLAALATLGLGEVFLRGGERPAAMREFDQAMVSVTAGETSPTVAGIIYCAVIAACQQASDLRRADEWTTALDRWCARQPGLVPYRGQCLVHRSQILQVRGAWDEAAGAAESACQRLGDPPHPAIGMAHYQLGELHRLRGDLAAAEAAYREAHAAGHDPHPGRALLFLAEERVASAVTAIEMALGAARDVLERARLLPAYGEIMLAAHRTESARTAAEELARLAVEADNPVIDAIAARTLGAVLLAEGNLRDALGMLHTALHIWQELDAPYESAQVRVLLATACRQLGDTDRAELEGEAARQVFEQLGARPALRRLDRVFERPEPRVVTARELEVLRLVAGGHTNRDIADELSISQKTVERHLSNMFTKLGVANRAAATAYAYDHGLVD